MTFYNFHFWKSNLFVNSKSYKLSLRPNTLISLKKYVQINWLFKITNAIENRTLNSLNTFAMNIPWTDSIIQKKKENCSQKIVSFSMPDRQDPRTSTCTSLPRTAQGDRLPSCDFYSPESNGVRLIFIRMINDRRIQVQKASLNRMHTRWNKCYRHRATLDDRVFLKDFIRSQQFKLTSLLNG